MHQSGRFAIMPSMRASPQAGVHAVSAMAASALPRRSLWSIEMNHCGVVRVMMGVLWRQQCG